MKAESDIKLYADLKPLSIVQRCNFYRKHFSKWPQEDECNSFITHLPDHPEFVEQYGHFSLKDLTVTLESLPTHILAVVEYFTFAKFVLEETSKDVDFVDEFGVDHVFRAAQIKASWETNGTWLKPPLLCDASLVQPNRSGLQLIEGHTRIGCLIGLTRKPLVKVAKFHKCIMIR